MLKKFLTALKFSWKRHKLSRLYNDGEYKLALELVDGLQGTTEEMAKLKLFKADIFHRNGELLKSIAQYEEFLVEGVPEIKEQIDKKYLRLYAQYYLASAKTKSGQKDVVPVLQTEVAAAFHDATLLTRSDFEI